MKPKCKIFDEIIRRKYLYVNRVTFNSLYYLSSRLTLFALYQYEIGITQRDSLFLVLFRKGYYYYPGLSRDLILDFGHTPIEASGFTLIDTK